MLENTILVKHNGGRKTEPEVLIMNNSDIRKWKVLYLQESWAKHKLTLFHVFLWSLCFTQSMCHVIGNDLSFLIYFRCGDLALKINVSPFAGLSEDVRCPHWILQARGSLKLISKKRKKCLGKTALKKSWEECPKWV